MGDVLFMLFIEYGFLLYIVDLIDIFLFCEGFGVLLFVEGSEVVIWFFLNLVYNLWKSFFGV